MQNIPIIGTTPRGKIESIRLFPLAFVNEAEESLFGSYINVQAYSQLRYLLPYILALQILLIALELLLSFFFGAELSMLGNYSLALALYTFLVWQIFFGKQYRHFFIKFSSEIGALVYASLKLVVGLTLFKLFPEFCVELW